LSVLGEQPLRVELVVKWEVVLFLASCEVLF
jgi:hypothetical protein